MIMPFATYLRPRWQLAALLIAMSVACFGMSVFRFWITDTKTFLFLNWNLFLAFLPWVASTVLVALPVLQRHFVILLVVLAFWLLFFPNSPYILTDLFHLKARHGFPVWFDLVIILSFAWTGLLYGFASLLDIEMLLATYLRPWQIGVLVSVLLFVSSFGVYLGRFLRWNSWDIVSEPTELLYDVGERVLYPMQHQATWGMTLTMGLLLNMMYWTIKLIRNVPTSAQ